MYSSESEESDNNTKRINFNKFLYARHHKYEWKDLEFNALEKNLACVFHDSLIDINEQKIFDLWEHDFNINKNAHVCDILDFQRKMYTVSFEYQKLLYGSEKRKSSSKNEVS